MSEHVDVARQAPDLLDELAGVALAATPQDRVHAAAELADRLVRCAESNDAEALAALLRGNPRRPASAWRVLQFRLGDVTPSTDNAHDDPAAAVLAVARPSDGSHVASELVALDPDGSAWTALVRTDDELVVQVPSPRTLVGPARAPDATGPLLMAWREALGARPPAASGTTDTDRPVTPAEVSGASSAARSRPTAETPPGPGPRPVRTGEVPGGSRAARSRPTAEAPPGPSPTPVRTGEAPSGSGAARSQPTAETPPGPGPAPAEAGSDPAATTAAKTRPPAPDRTEGEPTPDPAASPEDGAAEDAAVHLDLSDQNRVGEPADPGRPDQQRAGDPAHPHRPDQSRTRAPGPAPGHAPVPGRTGAGAADRLDPVARTPDQVGAGDPAHPHRPGQSRARAPDPEPGAPAPTRTRPGATDRPDAAGRTRPAATDRHDASGAPLDRLRAALHADLVAALDRLDAPGAPLDRLRAGLQADLAARLTALEARLGLAAEEGARIGVARALDDVREELHQLRDQLARLEKHLTG